MGLLLVLLALPLLLVLLRGIEYYFFMVKVGDVCKNYDIIFCEEDENIKHLIEMLEDDHYYLTSKWSAYHFLFILDKKPIKTFFTLNILKIETIYSKESINKLKKYELI